MRIGGSKAIVPAGKTEERDQKMTMGFFPTCTGTELHKLQRCKVPKDRKEEEEERRERERAIYWQRPEQRQSVDCYFQTVHSELE